MTPGVIKKRSRSAGTMTPGVAFMAVGIIIIIIMIIILALKAERPSQMSLFALYVGFYRLSKKTTKRS